MKKQKVDMIKLAKLKMSEDQHDILKRLKGKYFSYDIETYPNCFCMVIQNILNPEFSVYYEVSPWRNDSVQLKKALLFLASKNVVFVGYNSMNFDWPVVDYFLNKINVKSDGKSISYMMWRKASEVIGRNRDEVFANTIWPRDQLIKQLDLFRMNHYDNAAKRTSLKALEYSMRLRNVSDLPFAPNTYLEEQDMPVMRAYNGHDVFSTTQLFINCLPMVEFREEISKREKRFAMSDNDMAIGKKFFTKQLETQIHPEICYSKDPISGDRITHQTPRDEIVVADVLFDYIEFERPEFRCVHEFFKNQVIRGTKGVFSELPYLKVIEDSTIVIKGRTRKRGGRTITTADRQVSLVDFMDRESIDKQLLKKPPEKVIVKNLHVIVDGLQYDFGTGGLHAAVQSEHVSAKDDEWCGEADVGSMYPSIAVTNKLFPEHLGVEFVGILAEFKLLRMKQKRDSKNKELSDAARSKALAISDMLKLAMNAGAFGDTNNEHSQFYDPKMTMYITINGQLMLAMLVEAILKIEGARVVQANTDGVVALFKKVHYDKYIDICSAWEKRTMLDLEYQPYTDLFSRTVNSYIAITDTDKVKLKGDYVIEGQMHQDLSYTVVSKAAADKLVHGKETKQFLLDHNNGYDDDHDFTLRAKINRKDTLLALTDLIDDFSDDELPPNYRKLAINLRYKYENTDPELMMEILSWEKGANGKLTKAKATIYSMLRFGMSLPKTLIARKEQNLCRYIISNEGEYLLKEMQPLPPKDDKPDKVTGLRYTAVRSGFKVKVCNNMDDFDRSALNLDWYEAETDKLTKPFDKKEDA